MNEQNGKQSIHPGVVGGRRVHPKTNSCANSSLNKRLKRQLIGLEKHVAEHPKDAVSQARISTIKSALSA